MRWRQTGLPLVGGGGQRVREAPTVQIGVMLDFRGNLYGPALNTNSPTRLSDSSGRCVPPVAATTSARTRVIRVRNSTPGVGRCFSSACVNGLLRPEPS